MTTRLACDNRKSVESRLCRQRTAKQSNHVFERPYMHSKAFRDKRFTYTLERLAIGTSCKLYFREYLIVNPKTAAEYAAMKMQMIENEFT